MSQLSDLSVEAIGKLESIFARTLKEPFGLLSEQAREDITSTVKDEVNNRIPEQIHAEFERMGNSLGQTSAAAYADLMRALQIKESVFAGTVEATQNGFEQVLGEFNKVTASIKEANKQLERYIEDAQKQSKRMEKHILITLYFSTAIAVLSIFGLLIMIL